MNSLAQGQGQVTPEGPYLKPAITKVEKNLVIFLAHRHLVPNLNGHALLHYIVFVEPDSYKAYTVLKYNIKVKINIIMFPG